MTAEETSEKENETKSEGMGQMGIPEMMKKCCSGEGFFSDCPSMMKDMMEKMRGQSCCGPRTKDTGPEEGRNESGADASNAAGKPAEKSAFGCS